MLTPREKSPLSETRTHDAASCRTASPTHYQLSNFRPPNKPILHYILQAIKKKKKKKKEEESREGNREKGK